MTPPESRCEHLAGERSTADVWIDTIRSRSTRAGGGRDGVEQLPGEPVDEVSSRRRSPRPAPRGSSPPGPPASRTPRHRSTSASSRSGSTQSCAARKTCPSSASSGSGTSSSPPSGRGSPPTRSMIHGSPVPVRDGGVPAGGERGCERARSHGRCVGRACPNERAAGDELRARRGAVRDVPVLRWHQYEAQEYEARGVILTVGCVVFITAASWIATFPISLSI